MINELIEQIGGRERLEAIVYAMGAEPCDADPILDSVTHGDIGKMARALLAVLDAKPFAAIGDEMLEEMRNGRKTGRIWSLSQLGGMEPDCLDALYVYLTPPEASAPDGWKLVPLEPTEEMNRAGWDAMNAHDAINPTYSAMLAAAPAPDGTI